MIRQRQGEGQSKLENGRTFPSTDDSVGLLRHRRKWMGHPPMWELSAKEDWTGMIPLFMATKCGSGKMVRPEVKHGPE